jgi:hypothetical protein
VARIVTAGPILARVTQNIFYLDFGNTVTMNVWFTSIRITKVANFRV